MRSLGLASIRLQLHTLHEPLPAFAVPLSIGNPRLDNAPRTLPEARTPREFIFDTWVKKGVRITDRYTLNHAKHPGFWVILLFLIRT
jgi:hypothetical protein